MRRTWVKVIIVTMTMVFVLGAGVAGAADKMPSGPEKILAGAGHGLARLCAAPILMVKEGLNFKKNGLLAPVKGFCAAVVDEATNVPRTAANMATIGNNTNYNGEAGQWSPEAKAVQDFIPAAYTF
jgi:hypothetical protein